MGRAIRGMARAPRQLTRAQPQEVSSGAQGAKWPDMCCGSEALLLPPAFTFSVCSFEQVAQERRSQANSERDVGGVVGHEVQA